MNSRRVAITGLGIVCSIGKNVDEFLHSLKEGRSGIGPITLFDTSKYPCKIGGRDQELSVGKILLKKRIEKTFQGRPVWAHCFGGGSEGLRD